MTAPFMTSPCSPPQSPQPLPLYIGDTWLFPYAYYQPQVDANGNVVVDANGNPVPNTSEPVVINAISGYLYLNGSPQAQTLPLSADADTNLAAGKFKFIAAPSITQAAQPTSCRGRSPFVIGFQPPQEWPNRLVVVMTDSLGDVTTLCRVQIAPVLR